QITTSSGCFPLIFNEWLNRPHSVAQNSAFTGIKFRTAGLNAPQYSVDRGYERLEHPEGEAQVDFGIMEAVHDGEILDIHALVMSFPASNTAFAVPMPSENLECFLGGLQALLKQAGGVPLTIRIDHLRPAVKKARKGDLEAQLTDAFRHFQQYYGFKVQVCNPRKGNEKGHVEGKVGYVRYNFFSLPPVIKDLEDLTNQLEQQLISDRQRIHYKKEVL